MKLKEVEVERLSPCQTLEKFKREFNNINTWESEGNTYFQFKHITMWRETKQSRKLFEDFMTIVANQYISRFWQL